MAKKSAELDWKKVGHYSFIAGIILAVLIALIPEISGMLSLVVLVGLGIIVGLLNVTGKETIGFLVAALVLMVSASTTALALGRIHTTLTTMWGNVITFVAFAAIVVALKTVYDLAQD